MRDTYFEGDIVVKKHWVEPSKKRCSNCNIPFEPGEVFIEREVNATMFVFCSEECVENFRLQELILDDDE